MAIELDKPAVAKYWIAYSDTVLHFGVTDTNQRTTTGLPNLEYFDDEQGQLKAIANLSANRASDLPAEGEPMNEGTIYNFGGTLVRVRQDHFRTADDPTTVPALFTIIRPQGEYMEWIAQEQVYTGDRRSYNGTDYECLQSHVTQFTPDLTPALWQVYTEPAAGEWAPRIEVQVDDVLTYEGTDYIALQAHTTQVGWEPPNVPSLWAVQSSTSEWQPGIQVTVDEVYSYQGTDYVVLQSHTTQVGWEPPNVPALFAPV